MRKRLSIVSVGLSIAMILSSVQPVLADERVVNLNDLDKAIQISQNATENATSIFEDTKLTPLLEKFKTSLAKEEVKEEKVVYFVEYDDASKKEDVQEQIKRIEDTKILYEYNIIFQGCAVETYPRNLETLQTIKGVKSVERSSKMQPLMENVRKIIGVEKAVDYLKDIKAYGEAASKCDGRGMLIANIDTGMDYRHKAMRIDEAAKPYMKIKKGDDPFWVSDKIPHAFNYLNGGKDTIEKYDDGSAYYDPHGMHIGGILAANDTMEDVNKGKGIRGVAPNAQVLCYKMYSDASDGFAGDETMFHAFEDCIKHDADVASISSGFTGTGLVGEKYWPAIRVMRKNGIPVFVATGNFATSASNSSWDRYANNALQMKDTGNTTRTAAHEDAIGVGSSRNTVIHFPAVKINDKEFRYSQIGAFFNKDKFKGTKDYKFVYLGKCQDEDIAGRNLRGKIVIMDRIYTGDLKYAFKKVQDKGAKMVIVVNTVSYYNRDDWENIPAMGYDRDEKTKMQVISLSGFDGAMLWDMITGNATPGVVSSANYRIDMKAFNKRKPKVGDEKTFSFSFPDKTIDWEDQPVPAGSTSWGPRNDLMLKPDLTAPGKNILSTLNKVDGKDDYVYASGTSMATPVAAGASVLIRPKLKRMVNKDILKNVTFTSTPDEYQDKMNPCKKYDMQHGIDLTSLTKIVMQNTATPMLDPTTGKNADEQLFASPRQQGAGLINVDKALRTDVIATYNVKDSVGIENAYGAVSLKEIKGSGKDFTITLYNTGDKDAVYEVSASDVTTDGEINVLKLDEEYIDDEHAQGKQQIAEIHPTRIDGATVTFEGQKVARIEVKAGESYKLNAKIDVGSAMGADKFVESFIKFTPMNNSNIASLSMPLMGFAGDWNREPIIDKWAWEEGSKSSGISIMGEDGKIKRPGTLNYGRGGEHGIDLFYPTGVIQNTKDGNPNFVQDPELFALNTNNDVMATKHINSKIIEGKGAKIDYDVNNAGLTPDPFVLRSASDADIYIESEGGKNLRTMAKQHFVRGVLNSRRNTAKGLKESKSKVWGDFKWDGTIFNPQMVDTGGDVQGDLDRVAEGKYYYTFKYRLTPEYDWQISKIPMRVDNTSPTIESIDLSNPDKMIIKAKDTSHRAKDLSKTYFASYQKEHSNDFEEISTKVWFVGAAFVNPDDGNVIKEFKVIKNDEGAYEINEANASLEGKTIEIVVIDGAGNYAQPVRVKFDDQIDTNTGKLNYKISQYDGSSEWKDLNTNGSIDKNLLKKDNISSGGSSSPSDDDNYSPSQKPQIVINKEESTVGDLTKEVLKKNIKIRKFEKEDVTGNRREIYDDGTLNNKLPDDLKDKDGYPLYYDYDQDGNELSDIEKRDSNNTKKIKMEFSYENMAELKQKGLHYQVILNENNGFRITGKLQGVSRHARLYFASTDMEKTGKKKEIPTFNYDKKNHTMEFDFYGNREDSISNAKDTFNYDGDVSLFIEDIKATTGNTRSLNEIIRMPKVADLSQDPSYDPLLGEDDHKGYNLKIGNIEDFKADDDNNTEKPKVTKTSETLTNTHYGVKENYDVYEINDTIKLKKGYAVKIISYNAGKMSTTPLYNRIFYADPKELGDKEEAESPANIKILTGFNVIRVELYKPHLNSEGGFDYTTDSSGKHLDLSKEPMIFEKGRCAYFDSDAMQLEFDSDTFNPYIPSDGNGTLYTRQSPMTIRGVAGDKGGFMWHLRINHYIIDEYLIYGDLRVDNSREFSFTTDVKDGDILDIGIKDYSGNGTPPVKSTDGNNKDRTLPSKFTIYLDNVKPEITYGTSMADATIQIPYSNGTSSTSSASSNLGIKIDDKTTNGSSGKIQRKEFYVNGKLFDSSKTYIATSDNPLKVKVIASDYANNTAVKEFTFDGTKVENESVTNYTITYDLNGGIGQLDNQTIPKGENLFLPYIKDKILPPFGKEFKGWKIGDTEALKNEGNIINVENNIKVTAIWKDKLLPEKLKVSFDLNGGAGDLYDVNLNTKEDDFILPDGKHVIYKKGKMFKGWDVLGKIFNSGDKIKIKKDTIIKALWNK